jgi:hypothetical protein
MGLDAWGPESNGSHARISVVTSGTSESLITALSETLLLCMTFDFFFHYFIFLIQYFLSTYVYIICLPLPRQINPVICWFQPASKFYFKIIFFIKITLVQIIRGFFKKNKIKISINPLNTETILTCQFLREKCMKLGCKMFFIVNFHLKIY